MAEQYELRVDHRGGPFDILGAMVFLRYRTFFDCQLKHTVSDPIKSKQFFLNYPNIFFYNLFNLIFRTIFSNNLFQLFAEQSFFTKKHNLPQESNGQPLIITYNLTHGPIVPAPLSTYKRGE